MKKKQHYKNHQHLHPAYHFFALPLSLIFFCTSIYLGISRVITNNSWLEGAYFFVAGSIAVIFVFLIRAYATLLQSRMIRQEMRLRYFIVSGQSFNNVENKLSTRQIAALRFASDNELVLLTEITLQEKLSPDEIKKKIKQWKGDYYQV